MEGKGKPEKETDYSRLVGRRFNEQRDLYSRLALGSRKMNRSLYLLSRIIRVYGRGHLGFSHVYHLDGLNGTLLSQGCTLEVAPSAGVVVRASIPCPEEEARSL